MQSEVINIPSNDIFYPTGSEDPVPITYQIRFLSTTTCELERQRVSIAILDD